MLENLRKMLDVLKSLRADPRIQLLSAAQRSIGKNFPGDDVYGCAIAVNAVHQMVWGRPICNGQSTNTVYMVVKNDKTWSEVKEPLPGDLIISPTSGNKIGHVGILNDNGTILSNNSLNGRFEMKYTLKTWLQRYRDFLKLETHYFRKVISG